jgi:hypothetical protein
MSNVALLHSNLGRLMRYYAEFYTPIVDGVRQEFSIQERQSYHKAFDYYLHGLKLVEHRSDLFDVYRTLSWELSNSYFTMATLLQDYAPLTSLSQEDVSRCSNEHDSYIDSFDFFIYSVESAILFKHVYRRMNSHARHC